MLTVDIFHILLATHIVTGSIGAVAFWVPIASEKGGTRHAKFGKLFTLMMLITGFVSIGMASATLIAPLPTHPEIPDEVLVRGVFGWMMLYLAILTINLAWHGWRVAVNKRNYERNLEWRNILLQILLFVSALNCFIQGVLISQPLMMGISLVGFATVFTNVNFLRKTEPTVFDWQLEHIKSIVGAGISVYTAFTAFGAVRLFPELALNIFLWAVPLTIGISLIIYHRLKVRNRYKKQRADIPADIQPQS